jgi:hypothetical protein
MAGFELSQFPPWITRSGGNRSVTVDHRNVRSSVGVLAPFGGSPIPAFMTCDRC